MSSNNRRVWMANLAAGLGVAGSQLALADQLDGDTESSSTPSDDVAITGLRVTPIALPDSPLLSAGGCHGPYFLRNIVELETDAGIVGIGETHGGEAVTAALRNCERHLVGQGVFGYRKFAAEIRKLGNSVYAGIELACLDAIGHVTGRRLCELLGGPVREKVEFASYLFFRYAADHPSALDDPRLVDQRSKGDRALDPWGEVRTPESMADLSWKFHQKWGFRIHKLKAGVLQPEIELEALRAIADRFDGRHQVRIDPNGRWTIDTALRIGQKLKDLPLEYYEDPVDGQGSMAKVRRETGLPMSTNSCVTRFTHIADAVRNEPIDVVLGDHHGWGGLTAFQTLGTISESLGWGLSQHSNNHGGITMAAMIHAGACTPQLTFAGDTHYVWLVEGADLIEGPNLPIVDGQMAVPAGPGLGVTLDRDRLARAHETYQKSGMRRRDDAATMRRFEPGWKRDLF